MSKDLAVRLGFVLFFREVGLGGGAVYNIFQKEYWWLDGITEIIFFSPSALVRVIIRKVSLFVLK